MNGSHQERLINIGLLKPMSEDEKFRRMIAIASRSFAGKSDIPHFAVYRADEFYRYADADVDDDHKCRNAELIERCLVSYEARSLARSLNIYDKEQPKNRQGFPIELYIDIPINS